MAFFDFHMVFPVLKKDLQLSRPFCINIIGIGKPVFVEFVHGAIFGRRRRLRRDDPQSQEDTMEKQTKHRFARTSERLDLPGNILTDMSRMEVIGFGTLLLEQHKGILSYGLEEINVSVSDGVIRIKGDDLNLRSMDAQALLITGRIVTLEFVS